MPDDAIAEPDPEDRNTTRDLTIADADTMLKAVEFDVIGDGRMFERSIEIDSRAFLVSALFDGSITESSVGIDGDELLPIDENFFMDRAETADTGVCYTKIEPVGDGERCRLTFSGFLEAGRSVKVYVLVLFRRIRERWKELGCDDCKKLVKHIISGILFLAGTGGISMGLIELIPTEFWDWIRVNELPEAVTRILDHINPELLDRFRYALGLLTDLLDIAITPLTIILFLICLLLGYCPQKTQQPG